MQKTFLLVDAHFHLQGCLYMTRNPTEDNFFYFLKSDLVTFFLLWIL